MLWTSCKKGDRPWIHGTSQHTNATQVFTWESVDFNYPTLLWKGSFQFLKVVNTHDQIKIFTVYRGTSEGTLLFLMKENKTTEEFVFTEVFGFLKPAQPCYTRNSEFNQVLAGCSSVSVCGWRAELIRIWSKISSQDCFWETAIIGSQQNHHIGFLWWNHYNPAGIFEPVVDLRTNFQYQENSNFQVESRLSSVPDRVQFSIICKHTQRKNSIWVRSLIEL